MKRNTKPKRAAAALRIGVNMLGHRYAIYFCAGLCALLVLLYAYLASDTVRKVAALERGHGFIEEMRLAESELETSRVALESSLTVERGKDMGLHEQHSPFFIVPEAEIISAAR